MRVWCGAVLVSFSGVFIRLADVEATRSAFYRNAYALPAFLILLWLTHRGQSRPRWSSSVLIAMLVGGVEGAEVIAYHVSVGIIGAGLATVLPNLQVLIVGIAGLLFFNERPRSGFWVAVPIVFAGVWLLTATGETVSAGGSFLAGISVGLVGALLYSGYLILLRMFRKRNPDTSSIETMAAATVGIVVVTGIAAAAEGVAAPAASWSANGWLLLLALGTPVFGWLLIASSIHRLPGAMTSIALLLQPTLALVWGVALLNEPVGVVQIIGAIVILAGIAIAHRATSAMESH